MTVLGGGSQAQQTFAVGPLTPDEAANLQAHGFDPKDHVALALGAIEGGVGWGADPHGVYTFAQVLGRLPSAALAARSSLVVMPEQHAAPPLRPLMACIRLVVAMDELRVQVPAAADLWRVTCLVRPDAVVPSPYNAWQEVRPLIGTICLRDCLTPFEAQAAALGMMAFAEPGTVRIEPINPRSAGGEPDADSTDSDPRTG